MAASHDRRVFHFLWYNYGKRQTMKYNLRFFTYNAWDRSEQQCFARAISKHLPAIGDKVYLGDETIKRSEIDSGIIYKVEDVVLIFNNFDEEDDDLSSVEITLKAVP
jgi:hypothetical protein